MTAAAITRRRLWRKALAAQFAHLKKSSSGHLLKASSGHLSKGCPADECQHSSITIEFSGVDSGLCSGCFQDGSRDVSITHDSLSGVDGTYTLPFVGEANNSIHAPNNCDDIGGVVFCFYQKVISGGASYSDTEWNFSGDCSGDPDDTNTSTELTLEVQLVKGDPQKIAWVNAQVGSTPFWFEWDETDCEGTAGTPGQAIANQLPCSYNKSSDSGTATVTLPP